MMPPSLDRRSFLKTLAVGSASLSLQRPLSAADETSKKTYTYKTVGQCAIQADVYAAEGGKNRPAVLWIHGGALISGQRGGVPAALLGPSLKAGHVVVSIDYRLAPETKLPAILEDVHDAYQWLRTKGAEFAIDPNRIAVAGGSAGGYLTLTTGFRVEPRPRALVSFWGYGDITNPWYSQPDPFYCRQPLVPKEEAYQAVGSSVLSEPPPKHQRGRFYLYCRQQGLWPREVAGHDPLKEPRAFDPFCPIRNVTPRYPPTLLIHGTKDTDVPYEQSADMAKELARHGVEHELITVADGGHGLAGVKPDEVAKTYARALSFLGKHLR